MNLFSQGVTRGSKAYVCTGCPHWLVRGYAVFPAIALLSVSLAGMLLSSAVYLHRVGIASSTVQCFLAGTLLSSAACLGIHRPVGIAPSTVRCFVAPSLVCHTDMNG